MSDKLIFALTSATSQDELINFPMNQNIYLLVSWTFPSLSSAVSCVDQESEELPRSLIEASDGDR